MPKTNLVDKFRPFVGQVRGHPILSRSPAEISAFLRGEPSAETVAERLKIQEDLQEKKQARIIEYREEKERERHERENKRLRAEQSTPKLVILDDGVKARIVKLFELGKSHDEIVSITGVDMVRVSKTIIASYMKTRRKP